jgi:hypothetical protein
MTCMVHGIARAPAPKGGGDTIVINLALFVFFGHGCGGGGLAVKGRVGVW